MMIDLPNGRQAFEFDCGAKALQLVMAHYGLDVREDALLKDMVIGKHGIAPDSLIAAAAKYGFQVIAERGVSLDWVKRYVDANQPVIVLVQAWAGRHMTIDDWRKDADDGHYAIIIGYLDDMIVFEDPSSFQRTWLTEEEFDARWHDTEPDTKEEFNHFGIVLTGKTPVTRTMEHMG